MKVKDLKYYKPLDITQLSGSPWNDAEKVLGLDEDKKVIMAEPTEMATKEYVDDAIVEAEEITDGKLLNYYRKEEVDSFLADIDDEFTNYYTKDEVDEELNSIRERISTNENDIADLQTDKIGQYELDSALEPYATKGWVNSQSYANQNYVAFKVNEAMQIETARTESVYAKKSEIPDLDDYYTKDEVDEAIANVDVSDQLENYALTSSVTQDIQTAIASETGRTESVYAKKSEIPSLDNYYNKDQVDAEITGATEGLASEQYVDDAIAAIPQVDLSGYAKTTAVTQDIQTAIASETARTENTYAKPSQIPSLDGFAT